MNNDKINAIIFELCEARNTSEKRIEQHNVFAYVHSMAVELSNISFKNNNPLLSYLLNLAAQEALTAERTACREVSVY